MRFEAVFRSRPDAVPRLDAAASTLGWIATGEGDRRRYAGRGIEAEVVLELKQAEGWSTFATELPSATIQAHGWFTLEELLIAWCQALDVLLGRSVGPDGFPRLEPWELVGAVDAVDAIQWFSPALTRLRRFGDTKINAACERLIEGGLWLRTVDDPLEDPAAAADRAMSRLSLQRRARPPEVEAAVETARQARAARAPVLALDPEACLAALRTSIGRASEQELEKLLARATEAGVRDRIARHLHSCLEHYRLSDARVVLGLVARADVVLLASAPEDVVESVARVLAWRSPRDPLIEAEVALEHWLENANDAPPILRMLLEADDPDVVGGLITIDLVDIGRCPCERCADRRRRLASAGA